MSNKNIFSIDDYNSDNGMITSIWGPPFWHILHTLSFNYPLKPTNKQKKDYFNFYNNLKNILPCKSCRDNLKIHYDKYPLTDNVFKNRTNLSKYVFNLHEIVNTLLNKKSNLTYDKVRDLYEQFRSRCVDDPSLLIESGCTEPVVGIKSKCTLYIEPYNKNKSLIIDPKCIRKKKISKKSSVKK
jgi:hypothetical protein